VNKNRCIEEDHSKEEEVVVCALLYCLLSENKLPGTA
jgi:hypothetical protein